jgi:colicin import membrane protein
MRTPLTISAIGHAAFLLWGMLTFGYSHKAEPMEAVPIEVVTANDFAKLTAGNRAAPKRDNPKPVAEKVDAEHKPPEDVTAKIDKKEIKAATDKPPPPPPAAKPEPKPEPKPEAKAEPKSEPKSEPKREPKPEPKPKAEPKPKPEPKKSVAEKKPEPKPDLIAEALKKDVSKKDDAKKPEPKKSEPKKTEVKKAERSKPEPKKASHKEAKAAARREAKTSDANAETRREAPEFDSRSIAALLNKQKPQRLAATGDAINSTMSLGAPSGTAPQLSQTELGALRERLASLWNPPNAANPADITVVIRFRLKRNGMLDGGPQVLTTGRGPLFNAARDSAIRAIFRGQRYDMLRPEHYDLWSEIEIEFNPRDMFRG